MYPTHLRGVPPTPASAPRTPKPPATEGGTAYGPGLAAAEVGCTAVFTVEALDPYDERRRIGGDVVVARLMVGSDVTVEASALDNTDGTFTCTYVPKSVDRRQKLHVTMNGIPVRGSPFRPELTAGPVAARACTASGAELYDSVAGRATTIFVQARDCFGNPLRHGGHSFTLYARGSAPNRPEYKEVFRTFELVCVSSDLGDGTYALTWSADIPGGYDLHVTHDRTPILGSPFHCHLSSAFVRPPLEVAPSLVPYAETNAKTAQGKPAKSRDTAVPAPSEAPSAAMVDGQLVCLSTALSTPTAAHRWPSVHTCQFLSAYKDEAVYNAQAPPPCRWRSCLLPSHDFAARHTLVGGPSSVYVLSQSGGSRAPIDGIACCEVIGGAAWRPPQAFITLRPNGRTPEATEGFAALYIPAVDDCRIPGGSGEGDEEPPASPPKGGKGGKKGGGGGEEGEEGDAGPAFLQLPPCLLLVGGAAADGGYGLLDMYNLEEERWMGDPLEAEPDALTPEPFSHGAACAVPAKKGGGSYDVFVFGGRTAGGVTNQMWAFDVQAMAWREIEPRGEVPDGRSGHTMTRVLTRFLLVCGGVNGENAYCDDLALFDLHTESWSLHAPSAPLKRIGHVAGYASGRLYVFGGADGAGKASSELHAYDCDALFPQTAALTFEQDPSRVMVVKASPSLNGLLDKLSVECWVWPRSFVPNAPALVKADGNLKVGFGLVALDEATARKYVALDKEKVREGGAKERNPWENSLAEAERLPTMAFFVNGLKRETSALIRVLPEEWSHVAATFDGKMLTTYCNGRRADCVVIDPPLEEYLHTQGDLCVGGTPGKAAWDGHLDAARVWNSCLSWETIRAQMNDTLQGHTQPSMIGQWACNEGAGEVCYDSSSKSNHGSIANQSEGGPPVDRVMCTRDRIEPAKTVSEQHIDDNFERLRKWRVEFEKRVGREVTAADLVLADESIRKTARRLGLIS